jgi:hypothetical protein
MYEREAFVVGNRVENTTQDLTTGSRHSALLVPREVP